MTAISQPNHPARIAAIFFGTIAGFGIVLAAALSLYLIVLDQRDAAFGSVAVSSAAPGNIEAPPGLIVIIPVEDPQAFEELAGFAPFVPKRVPAFTDPVPNYAVTQPDANGLRVGRVAFSAKNEAVDGVTGPVIVISEAQGEPGEGVDGELKRIISGARALVATFGCGDLVLDVQMFFSPQEIAPGEELITPFMRDTARGFIDGLKTQCAGD